MHNLSSKGNVYIIFETTQYWLLFSIPMFTPYIHFKQKYFTVDSVFFIGFMSAVPWAQEKQIEMIDLM